MYRHVRARSFSIVRVWRRTCIHASSDRFSKPERGHDARAVSCLPSCDPAYDYEFLARPSGTLCVGRDEVDHDRRAARYGRHGRVDDIELLDVGLHGNLVCAAWNGNVHDRSLRRLERCREPALERGEDADDRSVREYYRRGDLRPGRRLTRGQRRTDGARTRRTIGNFRASDRERRGRQYDRRSRKFDESDLDYIERRERRDYAQGQQNNRYRPVDRSRLQRCDDRESHVHGNGSRTLE